MWALWCLSIRTDAEVGSCWTWLWQLTDCWAAGIGYLLLSLSLSFPTLWWASLQPPQLFYQVSMKTLSAHYKKKKNSFGLSAFSRCGHRCYKEQLLSLEVHVWILCSMLVVWFPVFLWMISAVCRSSSTKSKVTVKFGQKNGMPSNCMNIRNAT